MSKLQTALINFQNTTLITAQDADGKIFVALKPLISAMGVDVNSQYIKIKKDDRFNYRVIPMVGKDGLEREMGTLDLDHLPAFLYSINPNRVKEELRANIIAFQSETFAVINNYWRKKREPEIVITNTTDKEKLGGYETQIYMLKNENRELRRAINRITYNDKHLPPVMDGLTLGDYKRIYGDKDNVNVYYVSNGSVHFTDKLGQCSVRIEEFIKFFKKI
jgi:hypothetical protein